MTHKRGKSKKGKRRGKKQKQTKCCPPQKQNLYPLTPVGGEANKKFHSTFTFSMIMKFFLSSWKYEMLACNFFFLFQTFDSINHFFGKSYRNFYWYGSQLKEYTRLTVGEKCWSILILKYKIKLLLKFDLKQKPRIEFLTSEKIKRKSYFFLFYVSAF